MRYITYIPGRATRESDQGERPGRAITRLLVNRLNITGKNPKNLKNIREKVIYTYTTICIHVGETQEERENKPKLNLKYDYPGK